MSPSDKRLISLSIYLFIYLSVYLSRELVSKLRSMTETIKMLSTENIALRQENDQIIAAKKKGKYII